MKSFDLNRRLVESFPSLKNEYEEEVNWQEGDETGSHTVYGDVFTPYLVRCIEGNKRSEIKNAFDYIEKLLELEDKYVDEVITFSVLESIAYLFNEKKELADLVGKKMQQEIRAFL